MSVFTERVKAFRAKNKIMQKSVAAHLEVPLRTYQSYEYGEAEPSISTVAALSDFFSVPVDYFTGSGLFAQYEEITENRELITTYFEKLSGEQGLFGGKFSNADNSSPLSFVEILKTLSDINFVRALSGMVSKIDVDEEEKTISLFFWHEAP